MADLDWWRERFANAATQGDQEVSAGLQRKHCYFQLIVRDVIGKLKRGAHKHKEYRIHDIR